MGKEMQNTNIKPNRSHDLGNFNPKLVSHTTLEWFDGKNWIQCKKPNEHNHSDTPTRNLIEKISITNLELNSFYQLDYDLNRNPKIVQFQLPPDFYDNQTVQMTDLNIILNATWNWYE